MERVEKRLDQFDIRANPVEKEERRTRLVPASNADAEHLPLDLVHADLHLSLPDVAAGRCLPRRVLLAAQGGWRRCHGAGARLDPVEPVRPPAAAVLRCLRAPRLRVRCARRTGPEARLRIAGRIEQALNMAAVGEREGATLAVELRRF